MRSIESCSDNQLEYYEVGDSPPPPYSEGDFFEHKENNITDKELVKYSDVGEEIFVQFTKKPLCEIGLVLLYGQNFEPPWPAILDIKKNSLASQCKNIRIGDQIKELCGIRTDKLTHNQILALFNKATDIIYMTLRRGLEASDRSFDWFKYPFSTVSQKYDDVIITTTQKPRAIQTKKYSFSSFKGQDAPIKKDPCKPFIRELEGISRLPKLQVFPLQRKLSYQREQSLYMREREAREQSVYPRERLASVDSEDDLLAYKFNLMSKSSSYEGKYIVNEVEKMERKNSLSSAFSSSTISSFSSSSTSTSHENSCLETNRNHWMEQMSMATDDDVNGEPLTHSYLDNGTEIMKNICRSPVNTIRNSLRKRKEKRDDSISEDIKNETCEKAILHGGTDGNSFRVTVWIADRKKLGLRIGGGSVSPYGDSTINILDVKKNGMAAKAFKVGDELLEIDGKVTSGMDVYEANAILAKLEGNYVEFKVFRPCRKSK